MPYSSYIDGLIITKNASDKVTVSAGSCYDSTYTTVLKLASNTTKQNDAQYANQTYHVYIYGLATGNTGNITISTNSTTPTVPEGYVFRKLGSYTTDANNSINSISYYGNNSNSDKSSNSIFDILVPNYAAVVEIPSNESVAVNTYTAPSNGWFSATTNSGNPGAVSVKINDKIVAQANTMLTTVWFGTSCQLFVKKGDVLKWTNGSSNYEFAYFCPLRGV